MAERQKVGREPVVRAGLKLLDENGLDGLTLGAIAKELGVRAPTLYWRFASKQDLVDEMATQVVADWARSLAAPEPETTWQTVARDFAQRLRHALKAYRDGARLVAGTYLRDASLAAPLEAALGVFVAAGIAIGDAALCLNTLYTYTIGFTIEEQAVVPVAGDRDPRYDLAKRDARVDDQFPLVRAVGPHLFDDFDARFDRGVALILAGFAVDRERAAPAN